MKRSARLALVLLLAPGFAGCGTISDHTPPDGAWFDVVGHPGGGLPATLGFYAGVTVWTPFGFVIGSVLPAPADAAVERVPGDVLGTGLGLLVGAPFHLIALPFSGTDPEPIPEKAE